MPEAAIPRFLLRGPRRQRSERLVNTKEPVPLIMRVCQYGIYVVGIAVFVAALAIVQKHNVWTGGWPVLVTIFG